MGLAQWFSVLYLTVKRCSGKAFANGCTMRVLATFRRALFLARHSIFRLQFKMQTCVTLNRSRALQMRLNFCVKTFQMSTGVLFRLVRIYFRRKKSAQIVGGSPTWEEVNSRLRWLRVSTFTLHLPNAMFKTSLWWLAGAWKTAREAALVTQLLIISGSPYPRWEVPAILTRCVQLRMWSTLSMDKLTHFRRRQKASSNLDWM